MQLLQVAQGIYDKVLDSAMTPGNFRRNFVEAAFDGQYFILKVLEELTATGKLSPNWSIWDPAHGRAGRK